jgi:hypothetical protein
MKKLILFAMLSVSVCVECQETEQIKKLPEGECVELWDNVKKITLSRCVYIVKDKVGERDDWLLRTNQYDKLDIDPLRKPEWKYRSNEILEDKRK